MKCFLIIFSVIAVSVTNAKPCDANLCDTLAAAAAATAAAADTSVNVSDESNERVYSSIGIITKYPDDENGIFAQPPDIYELPDEIRMRRKINERYSSDNGSQEIVGANEENYKEQPTKVPLQGVIAAIETDLVTTALLASTPLKESMVANSNMENRTSAENDSIDANKNLFEDLFNFTRPERHTDGKENVAKIPLNGIVSAVETTLINSAKNLKDNKQLQSNADAKLEMNSKSNSNGAHRPNRDTNDKDVQIQTLDGIKSQQNLNILSSIAFKPVVNDTEMDNTTAIVDDIDMDTEHPEIQGTNFTVIQASDTLSLVPDGENKLAHVQHQAITKTVFQSNLAIFPMLTPKALTTPLLSNTSAEQTSKEEPNGRNAAASATLQSITSNATNKALKEKIAEVRAEPVILSSFP